MRVIYLLYEFLSEVSLGEPPIEMRPGIDHPNKGDKIEEDE